MHAVQANKPDYVKVLVEAGADVGLQIPRKQTSQAENEYRSVLHVAARYGEQTYAVLAELLKHPGVNINQKTTLSMDKVLLGTGRVWFAKTNLTMRN